MKGSAFVDQKELRREYEKQNTREGQEALRVKRELAARFSVVLNRPFEVGVIQPLRDGKTGEITRYFIAE